MGITSTFVKNYSRYIHRKVTHDKNNAEQDQLKTLLNLVDKAKNTSFGKKFQFSKIKNHNDFIDCVPISDYESFSEYIKQIQEGHFNITWPGKPLYFAKTSGTTSGAKYIPISKQSIHNHIDTARNSMFNYIFTQRKFDLLAGKMIFLSGSPELSKTANILTGRLSGIINHHIPFYLKKNQLPCWTTNCLENWEEKLDNIVSETIQEDMRVICGIPPWMIMYFEKLKQKTNKPIAEIFPNLSLIIHGGVNYQPYKKLLDDLLGKPIDMLETFPASEGFFAFQSDINDSSLLLNTNSGIYFEFIPLQHTPHSIKKRLNLSEVELNKPYILVISNNAGLWCYNTEDVVKFVSLKPFKLQVAGRVKHFISAFGEHVIGEEIDKVMSYSLQKVNMNVKEFTVAPFITSKDYSNQQSCHEWYIEFTSQPINLNDIAVEMDLHLQKLNIYYADLRKGNILNNLRIIPVKENGFSNYMKAIGKLGGQNKLPRLSNDRFIADFLISNNLIYEN